MTNPSGRTIFRPLELKRTTTNQCPGFVQHYANVSRSPTASQAKRSPTNRLRLLRSTKLSFLLACCQTPKMWDALRPSALALPPNEQSIRTGNASCLHVLPTALRVLVFRIYIHHVPSSLVFQHLRSAVQSLVVFQVSQAPLCRPISLSFPLLFLFPYPS